MVAPAPADSAGELVEVQIADVRVYLCVFINIQCIAWSAYQRPAIQEYFGHMSPILFG